MKYCSVLVQDPIQLAKLIKRPGQRQPCIQWHLNFDFFHCSFFISNGLNDVWAHV
jgi:hypothetical protein